MPDRSELDFLNDVASNVALLESDLLQNTPSPTATLPRWNAEMSPPASRRQLFFGLTASVWLVILLTLSTSAFCLYKHHTQVPAFKVVAKPIAQMQLGANVPGVNPLEPDDLAWGTRVDPETWRSIVLTAQQEDGSDVELQLLRPVDWIQANNIRIGEFVNLDFGRVGVVGLLRVDSIRPCPTIRPGPGRTVTGIIRHHAREVVTLVTENGEQIGLTPGHEIWSEDRGAFIAASDLRPTETLRLLNGMTRVAEIIPRQSGETVYTLEVQVSHVFHVATSGLLVHNCDFVAPRKVTKAGEEIRSITVTGWSKGKEAGHFADHAADMGITSQKAYTDAAKSLAKKTTDVIEAKVGNTLFKYDKSTQNILIINSGNRKIKTFYKADNGLQSFKEAMQSHWEVLKSQGHKP